MELLGGPLDGLFLDMSTLTAADIATGFALIADHGGRYPGGRALALRPRPGQARRAAPERRRAVGGPHALALLAGPEHYHWR